MPPALADREALLLPTIGQAILPSFPPSIKLTRVPCNRLKLSIVVIPVSYFLWQRSRAPKSKEDAEGNQPARDYDKVNLDHDSLGSLSPEPAKILRN